MKLFEYGIEPAVMGDFADARLIASHLGRRAKRMLSAYPSWRKWRKWALEESARSGSRDKQLARHQELIRSLKRSILETDRAYDPEKGWVTNALDQQNREETRFHAIVATANPDGREDVLEIHEIDGDNVVWNPASYSLDPLQLTDELDGSIRGFGERFWELVRLKCPDLDKKLGESCSIRRVGFSDRYIRSPLTVRLAIEVVGQLRSFPCASSRPFAGRLSTVFMTGTGTRTPPSLVQHDWQPGFRREDVVETAADVLGLDLRLEECKRRESVHWRELTIEWADGARWAVILDEGLGFLEPSAAFPFDFRADAEVQARNLLDAEFDLQRRSSAATLFLLGGVEPAD